MSIEKDYGIPLTRKQVAQLIHGANIINDSQLLDILSILQYQMNNMDDGVKGSQEKVHEQFQHLVVFSKMNPERMNVLCAHIPGYF